MEDVPRGVHVNFLKAERSLHRWALEDLQRIHAAEEQAVEEGGGVEMHVLEDAGHWVSHIFTDVFICLLNILLAFTFFYLFEFTASLSCVSCHAFSFHGDKQLYFVWFTHLIYVDPVQHTSVFLNG